MPKTKETHHMVKRMNLEYIQRGIILVNTSRGSVIHEADLCEAIGKGWIGAVGLDVFDKEPLPRNSPLLNFANVTLTPHIGASTTEAFGKASHEAAEKIVAFLTQNQASDTLPPQEIWYHTPFLAFDD